MKKNFSLALLLATSFFVLNSMEENIARTENLELLGKVQDLTNSVEIHSGEISQVLEQGGQVVVNTAESVTAPKVEQKFLSFTTLRTAFVDRIPTKDEAVLFLTDKKVIGSAVATITAACGLYYLIKVASEQEEVVIEQLDNN